MADTVEYFATTLPNKFTNDSDFRDSIQDIFEFQIEGAGTWHILPEGGVVEGNHKEPACVVTTDKETFDAVLDDSDLAMSKFMEGKIAASDLGLAMQLTQFLD